MKVQDESILGRSVLQGGLPPPWPPTPTKPPRVA
jgi:hypothetical protein